ncbi:MAG: serine hydrolase domain-containing protein [Flavobacteriaceae bacterium]
MNKILIGLLLLAGLVACKQGHNKQQKTGTLTVNSVYADSLTAQLLNIYEIGKINGLGLAVVDTGGIRYEKGFGMMDIASKKAYTPETLQNIASISKTFIGIALMKAQEMGILKLDDHVNEYIPFKVINPHFPSDPITIRQLASHTSSIRDTEVYNEKAYVLKEELPDSLTTMIDEILNPPGTKLSLSEFLPKILASDGIYYSEDVFLKAKPGSKFEYSNVGATLAAYVLETASGVPFDQFTTNHILEPLGMNSTGWSFDSVDMEFHSVLYSDPDTDIPYYELITYPDGGLRSSTHDMGLYLLELIRAKKGDGRLLSAESYQEYFKPVLNDSHFEERDAEFPYNDEYNMGVFMGHSGTGNIGHTGGDPGITSIMFFNPENSVGLYLVFNTSINDEEGVNQLFSTVQTLEEYGPKLLMTEVSD